jgi:hypothetical protein
MENTADVVVYSDNVKTRRQVIDTVGPRPHRDLSTLSYREIATPAALIACLDDRGADLVILDGEATPAGGLGIARQLTDELTECPPIVVLLGRPQDAWLARWSRAHAAVRWPADPLAFSGVVSGILLQRSVYGAQPM